MHPVRQIDCHGGWVDMRDDKGPAGSFMQPRQPVRGIGH